MVFDHNLEDERSEAEEEDEEGSTQTKRERMGLPPDAGKESAQNGDAGTPTVLLNGQPVDVSESAKSSTKRAKTSGRRSVEVKAQERRKVNGSR